MGLGTGHAYLNRSDSGKITAIAVFTTYLTRYAMKARVNGGVDVVGEDEIAAHRFVRPVRPEIVQRSTAVVSPNPAACLPDIPEFRPNSITVYRETSCLRPGSNCLILSRRRIFVP